MNCIIAGLENAQTMVRAASERLGSKTKPPLDDEDRRLLAIFRALRADEEAAAQLISNPQLLNAAWCFRPTGSWSRALQARGSCVIWLCLISECVASVRKIDEVRMDRDLGFLLTALFAIFQQRVRVRFPAEWDVCTPSVAG
jgi:hypothetical protein